MRRVARGEWEGAELCVDWTQAEEEARTVKREADTVHDEYLKRRREMRKRKSEHEINKRIKREDFEKEVSIPDKSEEDAVSNGRKCKKTTSYKIEDEEIDRLLEDDHSIKEETTASSKDAKLESSSINIDASPKSEKIFPETDQQILLTS